MGSQMFTDGKFNDVNGELTEDGSLQMSGGSKRWRMTRRSAGP